MGLSTTLRAVAVLALLLSPLAAWAQQSDLPYHGARTGELAALCDATASGVSKGAAVAFCEGFLISAGQYHQELTTENGAQRPIFCLPNPSPTFNEVRMAFVAWVSANPQYSADRSIDGLLRFAAEKYPCPIVAPASPRRRP